MGISKSVLLWLFLGVHSLAQAEQTTCKSFDEKIKNVEALDSSLKAPLSDKSCKNPDYQVLLRLELALQALAEPENLSTLIAATKEACAAVLFPPLSKKQKQRFKELESLALEKLNKLVPKTASSAPALVCKDGDKSLACSLKNSLSTLKNLCNEDLAAEPTSKNEPLSAPQEVVFNHHAGASVSDAANVNAPTHKGVARKGQSNTSNDFSNLSQKQGCIPGSTMTADMSQKEREDGNICPAVEGKAKSEQNIVQSPVPAAEDHKKKSNSGRSKAGQSQAPSYACTPGAASGKTSSVPYATEIFAKPAICQPDNDPFVTIFHQHPSPGVPSSWAVGGTLNKEEWKDLYKHTGHTAPYILTNTYHISQSNNPSGLFEAIGQDTLPMQAAQELGRFTGGGFYGLPEGQMDVVRAIYNSPIGQKITHWSHDEETMDRSAAGYLSRIKKLYVDELLASRKAKGNPAPHMITQWLIHNNDPAGNLATHRAAGFTHGNNVYYVYERYSKDILHHLFFTLMSSIRMRPEFNDLITPEEKARRDGIRATQPGALQWIPSVDNVSRFSQSWLGNAWDVNGPTPALPPEEYASLISLATLDGNRYYFIFTSMSEGTLGLKGQPSSDTAKFNANSIYAAAKAANWFESTKNTFKDSDYTYNFPLIDKSDNVALRSRQHATTKEQWFAAIAYSGNPSVRAQLSANTGTLTNLATGQKTNITNGTASIRLSRIAELYHFAPSGVSAPSTSQLPVVASSSSAISSSASNNNSSAAANPNAPQITLQASATSVVSGGSTQSSAMPANAGIKILIDAGSKQKYVGGGHTWSADYGSATGKILDRGAKILRIMKNTSDPALYRTERRALGDYTFKNFPNGDYTVKLHFAENGERGTNKRVFNVTIEGKPQLTNIDIYKEAGDRNIALVKSVDVSVSDGELNLVFTPIRGETVIHALEIESKNTSGGSSGASSTAINPAGGPGGYATMLMNDSFGSSKAGANITSVSQFNPSSAYGANGVGWDRGVKFYRPEIKDQANIAIKPTHLEIYPPAQKAMAGFIASHMEFLPQGNERIYLELRAMLGRNSNLSQAFWFYRGNGANASAANRNTIDGMKVQSSGQAVSAFTIASHRIDNNIWSHEGPITIQANNDLSSNFNTYAWEFYRAANGKLMMDMYLNGVKQGGFSQGINWTDSSPALLIGWDEINTDSSGVIKLDYVRAWKKGSSGSAASSSSSSSSSSVASSNGSSNTGGTVSSSSASSVASSSSSAAPIAAQGLPYSCTPGANSGKTSSVPYAAQLFAKPAICQPDNDPFVTIFHPHPGGSWIVGGDMSKDEWKNVYRHMGYIGPYNIIRAYLTNGTWDDNIIGDMTAQRAAQELGRANGGGFYDMPAGATEAKVRSLYREPIGLNITHWAHDDEPETWGRVIDTNVLANWKKWYVDEMLAARREAGKPAPQMITNWLISDNPGFASHGVNGLSSYLAAGFTHGDFAYYNHAVHGRDPLTNFFVDQVVYNDRRDWSKQKSVNSSAPFSHGWLGNDEIDWGYGKLAILPPAEYASLITLATLEGTRNYSIFSQMSQGRMGPAGASAAESARFNADTIYAMAVAASAFESTKNSIKNSTYTHDTPLQNKSADIVFRSRRNGNEMWFAGIALSGSGTPSVAVKLSANTGTLTNLATGVKTNITNGSASIKLSRITELYHFKP